MFKRILEVLTTKEENPHRDMYREWDRLRANALTPSERAEIDAIFSRANI